MADLHADLAALHPDCYGWALACCNRDREHAEDALQRAYFFFSPSDAGALELNFLT